MKRSLLVLSLLAVLSVSACNNGGSWTPMSGGRTAGETTTQTTTKADTAVSHALRK